MNLFEERAPHPLAPSPQGEGERGRGVFPFSLRRRG